MITEDDDKKYHIKYEDQEHYIYEELTKSEYNSFFSFHSMQMRHEQQYSKYIEHSKLTDSSLYSRQVDKSKSINDELYDVEMKKCLLESINTLIDKQRKRLVDYYFNNKTLKEIATKESCSIVAVKLSIDNAVKHLKEKMKKFNI